MKSLLKFISLMLASAVLFDVTLSSDHGHPMRAHGHWRLAVRGQLDPTPTIDGAGSTVSPCSGAGCVSIQPYHHNLPCNDANGTTFAAGTNEQEWTLLCDVDFFAQDIYPFILAGSFDECLAHCDDYNQKNHNTQCAGFVFAPDRTGSDNDCYLKSSTGYVINPSTIHLIGATLVPQSSSLSASAQNPTTSANTNEKQPDTEANSTSPNSFQIKLLGTSTDKATKQYVSHLPAVLQKLASDLLQPGLNVDLITEYPLAADTGSWTESNVPFGVELGNLSDTPRLSRDGGKGGNINGTHIFYFCDTSTFGDTEGPLGYMNGFVSSSAAVDVSRNALRGEALELENPIGQWQDDVGRLRGWIPMTTGEEAFNVAVSGDGFRYAVWPESSFIPLNASHSLIYAPLVYVEVDMKTQHADFTSLGNTLIAVSVDPKYGPHADRIVNQLFNQDEVEWGSLGGFRAWTETGNGTNDGMVYLFGQGDGGILVSKVAATNITDRSAYVFWNGSAWGTDMPNKNSTQAYIVNQPVMDVDIFYVPIHQTFVMFYLTPYADNTLYVRRLERASIIPPYMPGGMEDWAESLVHYDWSEPEVAYKADVPASGYIYAMGCHVGYFGNNDYANGGHSLLITWTEHTPKDPNNPASGYAHKSAVLYGY